ncbi:unnamed protein product [Ixodes hexagonus]
MYPSNVHNKMHISSSPKDQPLLTLRFPKKLWRIVNECRSGAIAWSGDGSAVVIDYSKFQSDYLDNRLDIFKTSNITSFIRQLNLYGFRKVSPQAKLTPSYELSSAGAPKNADVHVFRNDSFVRGRPDLLQGVARKTGALRARMMHRKTGALPQFSASPSRTDRAFLERARMMHPQNRHMSARHRQLLLRRALEKQRNASSRSSTSSTSGSPDAGPSPLLPGDYEDDMSWYSQESSTDSSSSDEEYDCGYPETDDVAEVADLTGGQGVMAESSMASQMTGWPIDYGTSTTAVDGISQQATSSFSSSPSPSSSGCGDMVALLDPSKSPKVVLLHQGRDQYERHRTPPLEDSFMLDPVVGHMGDPLDSNLYYVFMTGDESGAAGTSPSVVPDGTQSDAHISASDQDLGYGRCGESRGFVPSPKSSTVGSKDSSDSYYCI